jgi:hypothetical protein
LPWVWTASLAIKTMRQSESIFASPVVVMSLVTDAARVTAIIKTG